MKIISRLNHHLWSGSSVPEHLYSVELKNEDMPEVIEKDSKLTFFPYTQMYHMIDSNLMLLGILVESNHRSHNNAFLVTETMKPAPEGIKLKEENYASLSEFVNFTESMKKLSESVPKMVNSFSSLNMLEFYKTVTAVKDEIITLGMMNSGIWIDLCKGGKINDSK